MNKSSLKTKQNGIVSIMVVSILVVLLSLVTIGFSRLMNRETRQALDKQLGLQSYYAAESGVNDAITYLNKIKQSGGDITTAGISKCSDNKAKGLNNNLSGEPNPNAQYSCVLIDPEPYSIQYDIKAGQSKVFSFDQSLLTSMLITWQNDGAQIANNFRPTGSTTFPSANGWTNTKGATGATGALRISIYPVMLDPTLADYPALHTPNPPGLNNSWLDDRTVTAKFARTFFLYPDKAANPAAPITPVDYYDNNGKIISGQCDDSHTSIDQVSFPGPPGSSSYNCNVVLNCLPDAVHGPDGSQSLDRTPPYNHPPLSCGGHGVNAPAFKDYRAQHYYVKITSLYADTTVEMRSALSVGFKAVKFSGAQAVIDSTGKGNDVLRRVSARVSLSANGNGEVGSDLASPDVALRTAESVCKRIRQLTVGTIAVEAAVDPTCSEGITP